MSENPWQEVFKQIWSKSSQLCGEDADVQELNAQFLSPEKYGCIKIGEVHITSGRIEIGDPLCYMNTDYSCVLEKTIPSGNYPVYVSVIAHPVFGMRYMSAKLDVNGKTPVRYELAMPQGHTIEDKNKPGVFAGFGVDTGLGCFCDRETAKAYAAFLENWQKEHPGQNHYDDYFAALFKESARNFPLEQGEEGDYLSFEIPGAENQNLVMMSSGFGDGFYSAHWGYDENGEIACLVIRFIDSRAYDVPMPTMPKRKEFFLKPEQIEKRIESEQFCVASDKIMVEGCKVGYMHRDEPQEDHPEDSGWIFYEGSEDNVYLDNSSNFGIYKLNTLANYDADILPFLDAPVGKSYFRGADGVLREDV